MIGLLGNISLNRVKRGYREKFILKRLLKNKRFRAEYRSAFLMSSSKKPSEVLASRQIWLQKIEIKFFQFLAMYWSTLHSLLIRLTVRKKRPNLIYALKNKTVLLIGPSILNENSMNSDTVVQFNSTQPVKTAKCNIVYFNNVRIDLQTKNDKLTSIVENFDFVLLKQNSTNKQLASKYPNIVLIPTLNYLCPIGDLLSFPLLAFFLASLQVHDEKII